MTTSYLPKRAMAVFAHPDDIEFVCAGTAARWSAQGTQVCYVLCTSGDVGISEPGMSRERATEIREAEARSAAAIAGVGEIVFLREPDGMLQATLDLRKKLVREIRRFRPEVIITGDPSSYFESDDYINHPDHRAAALGALEAAFPAAGQPNLFEELEQEGLKAHKVRKVFVATSTKSNYFVSIDSTIETKIRALSAHKSQIKGDWVEKLLREWAAESARGKEMDYAEEYRVITLLDDEAWEKLQSSHS